jgi:tRNA G18 (ribose-2'-O)-methylase SpoU
MDKDTRNIIDYYHYWNNEAILTDLDTKRHNFSILCSNIGYDFNLSSVVRNSNAFLAKEVIIYGRKKYDRRGAVGTHNYTHFKHVKETDNLDEVFSEFNLVVGIDNINTAKPIENFKWDSNIKTLICFGQEQIGLPQEVIQRCHHLLYIKQYGSVRSLNVGCASAIVMYDYCNKVSNK